MSNGGSNVASFNMGVERGDRVQIRGFSDVWSTVRDILGTVEAGGGHRPFILSGVRDIDGVSVGIEDIIKHQKGANNVAKTTRTPQENLEYARGMLSKLTAEGADNRVLGLWASKVTQAEKLVEDSTGRKAKADAKAATGAVAKDPFVPVEKAVAAAEKVKKERVAPAPCMCGCGNNASSGKRFIPGHDARFASYIRKLDQSLVQLTELPESVQKLVAENHEAVLKAREHNKPRDAK